MTRTKAAVLALVFLLAGCGGEPASGGMTVTKTELGDDWPLTVESGLLGCKSDGGVTIRVDDTVYALNGTAKTSGAGADLAPVWADDTELGNGLKKDVGPLIQRAREFCGFA